MADYGIPDYGIMEKAKKGSQDASGIWRFTDILTGTNYSYNPVANSTMISYGNQTPFTEDDLIRQGDPKTTALKFGTQDSNGNYSYYDAVRGVVLSYNPKTGSTSQKDAKSLGLDSSNLFNGGTGNGTNNSSAGNASSGGANSTGSLFGSGYLGTGVNFDEYVNKMKDLTQWRLGVDKQSMENAYGFRDKEATRDYGFQTGLAGQQIQGQKDLTGMQITGQKELQGQQIEGASNLEKLRNEYMNQRQTQQLDTQKQMQQSGFSQQNKLLSDNANRAKSLFFGR